ncbi:MAG: hypothetical protein HY860_02820 [Chlamydiales bacterium]|nr:hypothetical protein [Chlamydiales bacterium]
MDRSISVAVKSQEEIQTIRTLEIDPETNMLRSLTNKWIVGFIGDVVQELIAPVGDVVKKHDQSIVRNTMHVLATPFKVIETAFRLMGLVALPMLLFKNTPMVGYGDSVSNFYKKEFVKIGLEELLDVVGVLVYAVAALVKTVSYIFGPMNKQEIKEPMPADRGIIRLSSESQAHVAVDAETTRPVSASEPLPLTKTTDEDARIKLLQDHITFMEQTITRQMDIVLAAVQRPQESIQRPAMPMMGPPQPSMTMGGVPRPSGPPRPSMASSSTPAEASSSAVAPPVTRSLVNTGSENTQDRPPGLMEELMQRLASGGSMQLKPASERIRPSAPIRPKPKTTPSSTNTVSTDVPPPSAVPKGKPQPPTEKPPQSSQRPTSSIDEVVADVPSSPPVTTGVASAGAPPVVNADESLPPAVSESFSSSIVAVSVGVLPPSPVTTGIASQDDASLSLSAVPTDAVNTGTA